MTTQDLAKLTAEQARDLRRVVDDALNKRYKRIEKAGLKEVSGSYEEAGIISGVGKGFRPHFTKERGTTRNEDVHALAQMALANTHQTGTVSGTRKYVRQVTLGIVGGAELASTKTLKPKERQALADKYYDLFMERKTDKGFWKAVRDVETQVFIHGGNDKYDSMNVLYRVNNAVVANPNKSPDDIAWEVYNSFDREWYADLYAEEEEDEKFWSNAWKNK